MGAPAPAARLSPRRRAFVAAMLAVVVLVAGAAAAWSLDLGGGGASVPQDRPGPVVLVPGYGGSAAGLAELAARLTAAGRRVAVLRLPGDGRGDLRDQAAALDQEVDRLLAGGAPSVDVVGYSAGGVVARVWAEELDGAERARRIVTLGSPHHGTDVAALAVGTVGGCPAACRQLTPGSDLLESLDADAPDGPQWVTVWTRLDQTVTPPETARLPGAVDVDVQAVCPDARVGHGGLPRDPLVLGVVVESLGRADVAAPTRTDCGRLRALGAG